MLSFNRMSTWFLTFYYPRIKKKGFWVLDDLPYMSIYLLLVVYRVPDFQQFLWKDSRTEKQS